MSAKLRLPPGLQTATFVVAVLAFGALTLAVSFTVLEPAPKHAAIQLAPRPVG